MNGDIRRVLKAPTEPVLDFASLQHHLDAHGLYASDKEDGIRCIIHPRLGPVSQTLKPIPNEWIKTCLCSSILVGLDGELIARRKGVDLDFNDTQSVVMSKEGQHGFQFRVFDDFSNQYDPYHQRMITARVKVQQYQDSIGDEGVVWLPHQRCKSVVDIEKYEKRALLKGKEGIMLNHPNGWYKEGRSTLAEAYLLKVKRFVDDEAVVYALEEEMENCNPATREASGLQKRSKHQANLKGKGMVGKLICEWKEKTIKIGSGMTHDQKRRWWKNPTLIYGKTITFKYQLHGMKDLPRAPIFKGIRYDA